MGGLFHGHRHPVMMMATTTLFMGVLLVAVYGANHDDHYDILPSPQPAPFNGRIGMRVNESTPYWPTPLAPPDGAPNVLLILIDDAGKG